MTDDSKLVMPPNIANPSPEDSTTASQPVDAESLTATGLSFTFTVTVAVFDRPPRASRVCSRRS